MGLPNQFLLRWLDRLDYPAAALVSVLTGISVLWFTNIRPFGIIWSVISACLWFLLIYVNNRPEELPERLQVFDPKSGWLSSLLVLTSATSIYLYASFHIPLVDILALVPLFAPPVLLYLRRRPDLDSRTWSVVILTIAVVFILIIGAILSIQSFNPSPPLHLDNGSINPVLISRYATLLLWAFFAPLYVYYMIRRFQLDVLRARSIQTAMLSLLTIDDPLVAAQEVVDILRKNAGLGERVIMLLYDFVSDNVRVIAISGKEAEKASNYELPRGKGISRRAIIEKKTQYVRYVRRDKDYVSGGLPNKGSEVSVPILAAHEKSSDVIGTINVQDNAVGAFTKDDIVIIEQFAEMISQIGIESSQQFDTLLQGQLATLSPITDPVELINQIVSIASTVFPESICCNLRLAIGTGIPLIDPNISPPEPFQRPELFNSPLLLRGDSDLIHWIGQWEEKYLRHPLNGLGLAENGKGFGSDFRLNEGIESICFLPIGTKQSRLGVLLMFFKDARIFSPGEIHHMRSFVRQIWPHIAIIEHMSSIHEGFSSPRLHFHSTLAEVGLERGAMDTIFNEIESYIKGTSPYGFQRKVHQLRKGLEKFVQKVDLWEASQFLRYQTRKSFSFKTRLEDVCADLQQKYNGVVIRELDAESLEGENPDTKLILLILIEEASRNALLHGEARQVLVRLACHANRIVVEVFDNGIGFDPIEAKRQISKTGAPRPGSIFELDDLCQRFLGAEPIDWLDTAPGHGARLSWQIPLLPKKARSNESR